MRIFFKPKIIFFKLEEKRCNRIDGEREKNAIRERINVIL